MRIKTRAAGLLLVVATAAYAGRGNSTGAATPDETGPGNPPATAPAPATAPLIPPARNGLSITDKQVIVSDAGTVELHVNGASLLEVLRLLSLQTQKNIIASKDVNGTVTANLYNVTVPEALDAILQSGGFVYRTKGNFIYVYSQKEMADLDKASRVLNTQVFRLYYTSSDDAMAMIKPMLSEDGKITASKPAVKGITTGGEAGAVTGGGSTDTGGNSYSGGDLLVVTDDATKLVEVGKLLAEIDHRPQEVLVEATIMAVTLSDNNSLGVDLSVLGGVNFSQFLQSPAQTIAGAAAGTLQAPTRTVTNSIASSSGTNSSTAQVGGQNGVGNYGVGQTSFTNQLPPGGVRVGVLTNSIALFVQALESVTNTTVLANPKVLSLDKQQGYVHVGRSDGYQTTTVSSTTSTQTVQFLDSGTTLSFRPYVGNDGYIRMEIHPEDSNGGLTTANLPFKTTTEVTANVMVQDGHTIVIGGLFRESSSTSRGQIPLLGDIPWLGALFRQQQDATNRQEVIILLTPHIIKDENAYTKLSEAEQKHIEELRVGVRKGMMFFGRERLAELAYENALAELNKPHPDKNLVLWHLDSATNLNPTFLEAIELKQKVSGRQVTDVDNSSMRSFVSRSILADQGPQPESAKAMELGTARKPGDPPELPTTRPDVPGGK